MAQRPKIYYPQDQITVGLKTSGKEWMLRNGTEFKGYYHTYKDGMIMTGFSYNEFTSEYLSPYQPQSSFKYDTLTQTNVKNYIIPQQYYPQPSKVDYDQGYVTRYFIRKSNNVDAKIIEIDVKQWNLIGSRIDPFLYLKTSLPWKLTGNESDVEQTNFKVVRKYNEELPGLQKYLRNYLELYKK
jgi:hypothetical protein